MTNLTILQAYDAMGDAESRVNFHTVFLIDLVCPVTLVWRCRRESNYVGDISGGLDGSPLSWVKSRRITGSHSHGASETMSCKVMHDVSK